MRNIQYFKWMFQSLLAMALVIGSSLPALAADDSSGHGGGGGDDGHHGKNHIALFLGQTSDDHDHDAVTFGLDYERRLSEKFGLGLVLDHAAEDLDTTVIGVALFLHPVGDLKLLLAPGAEFHDGHEEFLVRAGIAYDFHIKDWTIAPTYSVDFVDGEEIDIYGLAFGKSF